MTKSILVLALASALTASCSRGNPPQSSGAEKPAGAAAAPAATAEAPTAQPAASSTPAATPAASPAQPPAESPQPQAAAPAAASSPASTAAAPAPVTAQSPAPAAAPAPEPAAPPEPKFREVTIPAETPLSVTLATSIASNKSKVEDQVRGKLAKSIVIGGTTVVPAGSELTGSVIQAKESGRVQGRASIAFRFSRITVRGENHRIQTAQISHEAGSSTKSDVKKGALGAGAGAIIGGIAGGGTGAAIGAGVGGAGTVLVTKGKEVELPAGTAVSTRLMEPLKVLVPIVQK